MHAAPLEAVQQVQIDGVVGNVHYLRDIPFVSVVVDLQGKFGIIVQRTGPAGKDVAATDRGIRRADDRRTGGWRCQTRLIVSRSVPP